MGTSSVSMALKSSEVHQHEELQGVGVHLQRVLTFELLPAMVNQFRNATDQRTLVGTQRCRVAWVVL